MISAFFKGYRALGEKAYLNAAQKALIFLIEELQVKDGRLLRRYREGEAALPGYLDDYAFLVWALLEAYETTFDPSHLEQAMAFTRSMLDLFWDRANGGFFFTGKENETLITRSKDTQDGAHPSGNSVAASNLLRLGRITGDTSLEEKADALFRAFSDQVDKHPPGHTQLLQALDFMVGPIREVVIAGEPADKETRAMVEFIHRHFLPHQVTVLMPGGEEGVKLSALAPFVRDMTPVAGKTAAYVCSQYACQSPVTDPKKLEMSLGEYL
jgi:uncharacterized protein